MAGVFASGAAERHRVAVKVTLQSGEILSGNAPIPLQGRLKEHLNNTDRFLEFERHDGTNILLAKHAIHSIAAMEPPRADQLGRHVREASGFDPHTVLGVERAAGPVEIRTAYWAKAKLYHPDKLAGRDAPREVVDYLNAMFARLTMAYETLSGESAVTPPA